MKWVRHIEMLSPGDTLKTELMVVFAIMHLLWLRLGAKVVWLQDEMIVTLPEGATL